MPIKPDLYLDVDGVLVFLKQEPFMLGLIQAMLPRFDRVFWLSCWTRDGSADRLYADYPQLASLNAEPLVWRVLKTEALDWSRPFVWIEDGVLDEERAIFMDRAKYNQYVFEVRFSTQKWDEEIKKYGG